MGVTHTGHAEIDQQHAILDAMVARLQSFCSRAAEGAHVACSGCTQSKQSDCRAELTGLAGELGAFLVGHATYEERMMELLPNTLTCQAHIKAHKAAHQGISKQLKKIAIHVASDDPRDASQRIWTLVEDWLGDHTVLFDSRLVRMSRSSKPEINFDSELVTMLDQYVFTNRPTAPAPSAADDLVLQKRRMEVRGRFETMSPAQRAVFWLVVGGKKNRTIAEELGISVNTVKSHRAAIFQKMGVNSVIELLKMTEDMAFPARGRS